VTAIATYRSPVGALVVEATERGLCGVAFGRRTRGRPPISEEEKAVLDQALGALRDYFSGRPPRLPPLALEGSDFDRRVWQVLLEIPWGATRTYGEVARSLGEPGAARAVGSANGRNPVAILVPCHRVVAAGGRLGGYGGGLTAKRWLLAHEAGHAPALRPPG
jgi:methylated-DNA-[protein]-cysteine S-methyltransferase